MKRKTRANIDKGGMVLGVLGAIMLGGKAIVDIVTAKDDLDQLKKDQAEKEASGYYDEGDE